jgi:hypothetical protein
VPVPAEHPPWYLLVGLGWLQWAQAACAHLNHLVLALAAGLVDPGHTQPHQEPSRSCRSHASRCPVMPPVISTSGGAHGARSPATLQYAKPCSIRKARHHDQRGPI